MSGEPSPDGSLAGLAADLAVSPYEPLKFLARGGMGEVVVVQHRELGRKLVMKLLRTNLEGQEQLAERMRAEARMLARLSHPSLVTVVDSGRTAAGRPFLVTELLEGETLGEHASKRGGHLPVRDALELGIQALAGLRVVHEAGFVHRDLKPANLFVLEPRDGEPPRLKILDFGIAKALSDDDRRALGLVAPTTEGAIMGTPSSVSPEQVQSGRVDARTDVYGLGVVLFRLIVGRPPFTGDALALFRAHLLETPPTPSSVAPQSVSPAVDAIILKALEKEPSKRFQSAEEMRAAIELALAIPEAPDTEKDGDVPEPPTVVTSDASEDETTTQAMAPAARAVASPAAPAVRTAPPSTELMPTAAARGLVAPVSTTVISPSMIAAAAAIAPAGAAPSTPAASPAASPVGPSVRIPAAEAACASPLPRKTEMLRVAAANAPKDTVRLDEAPEPVASPWGGRPGSQARTPAPRASTANAQPRSLLATWGPILAAILAGALVLLALFVWRLV